MGPSCVTNILKSSCFIFIYYIYICVEIFFFLFFLQEAFSVLSILDQINSAVTFNGPISFKDQFKLFGFLLEFLPFFHHPSISLRIY